MHLLSEVTQFCLSYEAVVLLLTGEETKMKQLPQGYALPQSVPGPKSTSGSAHPSAQPLSLLPPCTSGYEKGLPRGPRGGGASRHFRCPRGRCPRI